jgi:hypothetical protein
MNQSEVLKLKFPNNERKKINKMVHLYKRLEQAEQKISEI